MNTETRKIKITIEGRSASGKTALGVIIHQALSKLGVEIDHQEPDMTPQHLQEMHDNIEDIVDYMNKRGVKVVIEEKPRGTDPF